VLPAVSSWAAAVPFQAGVIVRPSIFAQYGSVGGRFRLQLDRSHLTADWIS
jgi:hypothetical protein